LDSIAILLLVSLAGAYQPQPLVAGGTTKSLDAFGACFTQAQVRAGRAWSFVATDRGGSFSNEGAGNGGTPYRLQFTEDGTANRIRLYADQPMAAHTKLVEAVDRCR
jgi:hypothetical protein